MLFPNETTIARKQTDRLFSSLDKTEKQATFINETERALKASHQVAELKLNRKPINYSRAIDIICLQMLQRSLTCHLFLPEYPVCVRPNNPNIHANKLLNC